MESVEKEAEKFLKKEEGITEMEDTEELGRKVNCENVLPEWIPVFCLLVILKSIKKCFEILHLYYYMFRTYVCIWATFILNVIFLYQIVSHKTPTPLKIILLKLLKTS